jgi:hypothetical protein
MHKTRDTYYETGESAGLPAQLSERRGQMKWKSVRWGKKYSVLGRQEQQRQNKNLLYQQDKPANQTRKALFHLYSMSPYLPQFQQSAGAHGPPLPPPDSLCEVDAFVKKARDSNHRTETTGWSTASGEKASWPLVTIPYLYKWPVSMQWPCVRRVVTQAREFRV